MLRLLTGRLLAAVPLMFLVATLVFFLAQANSADPAGSILGLDASEEAVAAKRAELGVDRPLLTQYVDWLGSAVRGDLGTNWFTGEEITTELWDRIPVTVAMAFGGLSDRSGGRLFVRCGGRTEGGTLAGPHHHRRVVARYRDAELLDRARAGLLTSPCSSGGSRLCGHRAGPTACSGGSRRWCCPALRWAWPRRRPSRARRVRR